MTGFTVRFWPCVALLLLMLSNRCALGEEPPDWLVTRITRPTRLIHLANKVISLDNILIHRTFITNPDFATVDFFSYEKQSSLLRAVSPEAVITLDGVRYNIGGVLSDAPRAYWNKTAMEEDITVDPSAFHYDSYTTGTPEVLFPYTPMRGAPSDITWPPNGLKLDVHFTPPATAPAGHQMVRVTIHYEMYDGIPLITKWLSVKALAGAYGVMVGAPSVEYLSLNQQWAKNLLNHQNIQTVQGTYGWLFVETDEAHGSTVQWGTDPRQADMPGSYEPVLNCSYSPLLSVAIEEGFISYKVHELLIGSSSLERRNLAHKRMFRLLAPHTQENPIFFHLTNASSVAMRSAVDQMAEVGFEMLIYSFGSGVNIESTDPDYVAKIAADVTYAKSKHIEVGCYDLIDWTRSVKKSWMAMKSETVYGAGACFASGWFDFLLNQVIAFYEKTGMTMIETDGPYPGYSCASTDHAHHHGLQDSVYWQEKLQGEFFLEMRKRNIYINQPDSYFYKGGNRDGLGYNENQYSLPRWQDISISRQSVYDDTYGLPPTAGWMHVPLVDYHAGGDAAKFEPLDEHHVEYEWALAQYLGAGVAAAYRGFRLYDTTATKQLVQKWVTFYKKYRDIVTSDIVHVRRPDMRGIDSFMHVNPFLTRKGLAMVFNPTQDHIVTNLTLPLYYTGLSSMAVISEQDKKPDSYTLARDYSVQVLVDLPAYNITWFIIQ